MDSIELTNRLKGQKTVMIGAGVKFTQMATF